MPPSARTRRGLGRAFQLTNLFPQLTVLENVRLAVQSRADAGWSLFRTWSTRRDLIEQAEAVLERVRCRTSAMSRRRPCRTATSASSRSRC